MYKGFKLINFGDLLRENNGESYKEIEAYNQEYSNLLVEKFRNYISVVADSKSKTAKLNMLEIEKEWFPNQKFHVFISHSRNDKKIALALADWLKENFHMDSFIDSCFWSHANKMLREIDNKFCKNDDGFYDYNRRNFTTSNVHVLLNIALAKMIDKCDFYIFLKTDNSIEMREITSGGFTDSPWIYSELVMSNLIRKRSKTELLVEHAFSSAQESIAPCFEYDVDLKHLQDLDFASLKCIKNENKECDLHFFEDALFKLK